LGGECARNAGGTLTTTCIGTAVVVVVGGGEEGDEGDEGDEVDMGDMGDEVGKVGEVGDNGFVGVAVVLNSNVYSASHTVPNERPPWRDIVLFVSAMSKKPFKRFRESSFNLLIS
tara:strand:- start:543 stop:887 length:345 start_codon:yes stop_codon:yes gene_type:complete